MSSRFASHHANATPMPSEQEPDAGHRKRPWIRATAQVLVCALAVNALSPLSALAQGKGKAPVVNPAAQRQLQQMAQWQERIEAAKVERARSPAERVDDDLRQAQDVLLSLREDARARGTVPQAEPARGERRAAPRALAESQRSEHRRALRERLSAARAGQQLLQAEFERTGQELRAKQVPAEILARHEEAAQKFQSRRAEFERLHDAWERDSGDAPTAALADFFERHRAKRSPSPRAPQQLPWSAPRPTKRQPAETQTSWYQQLWADRQVKLAQAGGSIGGINFDIPPEPGQAPTEADLAPGAETELTADIRAKAQELGNNALKIHNWVRNSIEWVPTWGAIQSAQDTLDKQRGNAHDIASLEIALLRAAKIPARYQYGTIELPIEKLRNWIGGVAHPSAAQQLLGQGGIANRALVAGGQVAAIRMEHVWVQAYVNWAPSRGATQGKPDQHVHPVGPRNAWVALDPSYKQYSYTPGMDLKTAVPLDAQALLSAAQQGATVNEAQGWVQNLNQAALQSQLADYQNRLSNYIQSQNANATVGDVIGRKILQQQAPSLLAATLPYTVVSAGQQVSAVPSSLQHQFSYRLYASDTDRMLDSPLLSYTEKTSQLAGKRLTLSYVPATQADADVIASYLPKPHADGSPIQPSELPSSLPGYLIRLKPQLTLDGQVVASASQALTMGSDLYATGGFTQLYDPGQWDQTNDDSHVVGQATAIGISAGGISAGQLNRLKTRLEAAKTSLQSGDTAAIGTLSGEQLSGDLLAATIWSWFAAAESHNRLSQAQAGMVEVPGLSYGLFHAVAQPVYSWGVIRQVKFPGVNLDIGHVRNLSWASDNDANKWIAYNRLRGQYMSALEHAIPERFFNDPGQCNLEGTASPIPTLPACPQGVSAVKAIAIAAQAGQKIYTITAQVYADNPNIVNSALWAHSYETKGKVQAALDAGYEVTIHEAPITVSGWTGAGFTMIDPQTGAGGYLIEGGSSGGWLKIVLAITFLVIAAFLTVNLFLGGFIGLFGLLLGVGGAALSYIQLLNNIKKATNDDELNNAAAFAAIKGLASIMLSVLLLTFYSSLIVLGPITNLLPFSLINFAIFFISGWFFG